MTKQSSALDEKPQLKVDANGFFEVDLYVQDSKPISCRSVRHKDPIYDRFMKLASVSVKLDVGTQVIKYQRVPMPTTLNSSEIRQSLAK
ncbi:hypothetical protein SH501x_002301 [Pirellulaceae bacterium SH501]